MRLPGKELIRIVAIDVGRRADRASARRADTGSPIAGAGSWIECDEVRTIVQGARNTGVGAKAVFIGITRQCGHFQTRHSLHVAEFQSINGPLVTARQRVRRALVRVAGPKGWTFRVVLTNLIGARAVLRDFPFAASDAAILPILCPRFKPNGHADGNASV